MSVYEIDGPLVRAIRQLEERAEKAEGEAYTYKRDFEAELAGNKHYRERFGTRDNETMEMFYERLVRERDQAEKVRDEVLSKLHDVTRERDEVINKSVDRRSLYLEAQLADVDQRNIYLEERLARVLNERDGYHEELSKLHGVLKRNCELEAELREVTRERDQLILDVERVRGTVCAEHPTVENINDELALCRKERDEAKATLETYRSVASVAERTAEELREQLGLVTLTWGAVDAELRERAENAERERAENAERERDYALAKIAEMRDALAAAKHRWRSQVAELREVTRERDQLILDVERVREQTNPTKKETDMAVLAMILGAAMAACNGGWSLPIVTEKIAT